MRSESDALKLKFAVVCVYTCHSEYSLHSRALLARRTTGATMRDKLEKLIAAYEELERKLSDPSVVADQKEYTRLAKEHASQADLVARAREYLQALDDIETAKEMLHETTDPEEKEMLQEDIASNEERLPALEEDIKIMLIQAIRTTRKILSSRFARV